EEEGERKRDYTQQISAMTGSLTLNEYPGDLVRLSCEKCGRSDEAEINRALRCRYAAASTGCMMPAWFVMSIWFPKPKNFFVSEYGKKKARDGCHGPVEASGEPSGPTLSFCSSEGRSVCLLAVFSAASIRRGTRGKLGPNFEPKLSETRRNTVPRDALVSACHLEKCPICNASPSPNGTGCYLQPRPPKSGVAGSSRDIPVRLR